MGTLDGKVAVIAGASSGFGEALARHFRREGARLVLAARRKQVLEGVAGPLGALAVACDITDDDSVQNLVARSVEHCGRIDIAINSAGFEKQCLIRDLTPDELEPMVAVQFTGAVYFIRHMANAMAERGGGSVITISSLTASMVPASYAAYAGAKAGINQVTRIAALEYGGSGVRVNAVSPSIIETPMTSHLLAVDAVRSAFIENTPLGRIGDMDDVVNMCTFVASDQAKYVTGQNLLVDGGTSLMRLPTQEDVMRHMDAGPARQAPARPNVIFRQPPDAMDPRLSGEIEVDAADVWALISDFGDATWVPGVTRSELVGEGPGAVRHIYSGESAPPVKEELDRIDHAARAVHYHIGETNPLPVTHYQAVLRVVSLGEGRSRLEWCSTYDVPPDEDADGVALKVESVYELCFQTIKARLEGSEDAAAPSKGGATAEGLPEDVPLRDVFLEHMPPALNAERALLSDQTGKTLLFSLSGRESAAYCVHIGPADVEVHEGDPGNPSATIAMDSDDYRDMLNGKLDGASAFMAGRLQVDGDLGLAMKLRTLL